MAKILARVGSASLFDEGRRGWIDMTRAVRSPGSTFKPFIYGLAFDNGIAEPRTLIEDRPEDFGGYRPRNFSEDFRGTVSLREALQLSLNIPAVKLLDAAGPLRLVSLFRKAGVNAHLPRNASPTLAIALGGVGVTLEELVTLSQPCRAAACRPNCAKEWNLVRTRAKLIRHQCCSGRRQAGKSSIFCWAHRRPTG